MLSNYNIILGSASSRRKELLSDLGLRFSIKTSENDEEYPNHIEKTKIAEFLAKKKSDFISPDLKGNFLLITADTTVCRRNKILHKPKNKLDALNTLKILSNSSHKVITGVCIKTNKRELTFSSETLVFFNKLSINDMNHYIDTYKPFDKAGSYGIQEWIGSIGIEKIIGSYNNVVGLPTAELYQKLKLFI